VVVRAIMMKRGLMLCPSCQTDNHVSAHLCFACGTPLEPSLASLRAGALFDGRFEILGILGRGGMGMVYRAFDRELKETVALKVLRPDVARQSGRIERRFRTEIRLARRVRHRNVCSVYGDGEDQGLLYICMELIEGENLARAARVASGLTDRDAWDVTLQVSDGLRAIHEAGIVHRDLKTANIMRDRKRIVRVMDFGIAKHHVGATGSHTVTATGSLMGTPEYMSPEQLRGEPVGFRSDLYSFGIVIFELFTGALPFRGDSPVVTILRQIQDEPKLNVPGLPSPLRPILRRVLSKDPARRYATAQEMGRALREAHAATPGTDPRAGTGFGLRPADETRPLDPPPPPPEPPPFIRIAAGLLAVGALGLHLLSAGGVAGAAPVLPPPEPIGLADIPLAVPTPEPPPPAPVRRVARVRPRPSPSPVAATPAPRAEPAVAEPVVVLPPTRPEIALEPHRVYEQDEVDVPPHRIQGRSAPYPEWGPELSRGERASIEASFVVTEEGHVTDIRVEKGGGALQAVLVDISRWKYEPGLKDGIPVKVRVRMKHTFIGG
jgi:predicted Ser/Thr protein kinase/outer membrane biosynthesis protein TonB